MKISIITPVYNLVDHIEETIQSVLSQQGDFELEYIVIDAASTDGTLDVIKKYSNRLKFISEKDRGQADAINKGLKLATGDIVAFLNADDLYFPDTLQRVVTFFKENPSYKWVTGYCEIVDEKGRRIQSREWITEYKNSKLRKFSFMKLLVKNNFISQPSTFWTRSVYDEIGEFDINYHYSFDYEYWCRLASRYPLGFLPVYLSKFRYYDDSKTGSGAWKHVNEHYSITKKYTKNPVIRLMSRFSDYKKIIGNLLIKMIGK